ncbi:MAG: Cold shock protein of CSP family, partial [uncultured Nocardioidaceae bacterium]
WRKAPSNGSTRRRVSASSPRRVASPMCSSTSPPSTLRATSLSKRTSASSSRPRRARRVCRPRTSASS